MSTRRPTSRRTKAEPRANRYQWRFIFLAILLVASTSFSSAVAETVEVVDITLEQAPGEALVIIELTGPPSFRERVIDDGLIIELRDAVAGPSIGDLVPPSGLVEGILVRQTGADSDSPGLEIEIRVEGPHSAGASFGGGQPGRGSLQVRVLRPTKEPTLGNLTGPKPAPKAAPASRNASVNSRASKLASMNSEAAARRAADPTSRLDPPPLSDDEKAGRARRLDSVERIGLPIGNGADDFFVLRGNGPFDFEVLELPDPPRLVLDLHGVINEATKTTTAGTSVSGVRLGQFRPEPDPVTRVVLDLTVKAVPLIERTDHGLNIRMVPVSRIESLSSPKTTDIEVSSRPIVTPEPATAEPTSTPLPDSALPGSALPGSALPDSALPDSALPGSALPDSALPDSAVDATAIAQRYGEALRTKDERALEGLFTAGTELWTMRRGKPTRTARGRDKVARALIQGANGVDFGGLITAKRLVGILRQGPPEAGELDLLEVREGKVIRIWTF